MALDPHTFYPHGGVCLSSIETLKDGPIDLASSGEEAPSPVAFAALQAAVDNIETLRPIGLAAVNEQRQGADNLRSPPADDWAIISISGTDDGVGVATFYESEIDTYGAWDVSLRDTAVLKVERRQI